jgi:hypothetical protein
LRIARSECLNDQKRSFSGGDDAARSRTQGRGGQTRSIREINKSRLPKLKMARTTFEYSNVVLQVQGTLPCRGLRGA